MSNIAETRAFLPLPEDGSMQESPQEIVSKTGTILNRFLFGEFYESDLTKLYFAKRTLPFLKDAVQGFIISPRISRARMSPSELKLLSKLGEAPDLSGSSLRYQAATRSYTVASAIFLRMPALIADIPRSPAMPIPNEAMVRPPENTISTLTRIAELVRFSRQMAEGQVTPKALTLPTDSTRRSIVFFQVGLNLLTGEPAAFQNAMKKMM